MFIVTQEGHKIQVDDSCYGQDENHSCLQTVVLYDESVYLKEAWVLSLERSTKPFSRQTQFEFVKEVLFFHEPTEGEILHAMTLNGLSLSDFAHVQKGYVLERHHDE